MDFSILGAHGLRHTGFRGARHVTDASNASRTLLYDLKGRGWSEDMLELFGIPVSGKLAWLAWAAAYLIKMVGVRKQIEVGLDHLTHLVFTHDTSQILARRQILSDEELNLSLGVPEARLQQLPRRQLLQRAVEDCYFKDVLVIAAAHNEHPLTRSYPAAFAPPLLSVDKRLFADPPECRK